MSQAGLILSVYPGKKSVTSDYNHQNRLIGVTDWAGRVSSFSYDLAGRLTQITRPNGPKRMIYYDAAGRITGVWERTATNAVINYFSHTYDTADQMASEYIAPSPIAFAPAEANSSYNTDNQLVTFNSQSAVYDADGNMTSGPLNSSTAVTYSYDTRNRLAGVGGVTYAYDSEGNRVAMIRNGQTTTYVINPAAALSQVLIRRRADGTKTYYVYGLGLLYDVEMNGAGSETGVRHTYHYDFRGSTITLTDTKGAVTDRMNYGPYGLLTYRTGSSDTPFLYNGRYGVMTDGNGLYYMRARYYNPYICRFISAAPAGFSGGMNFYAYADGNPVSYIDPFGFESWALPPQLNQDKEFTTGFWQGVGAAFPAGVGLAGAVFLSPVAGGAALSAGVNVSGQWLIMANGGQANFSYWSLGIDTSIGAAAPAVLGRAVPWALRQLPRPMKGAIGEVSSYINGIFEGRGFAPVIREQITVAGRMPIPDLAYPGTGTAGETLYVEAKFGTAQLTSAQRSGANALGDNWITERWTYPWISATASQAGTWLSGANAAWSSTSAPWWPACSYNASK